MCQTSGAGGLRPAPGAWHKHRYNALGLVEAFVSNAWRGCGCVLHPVLWHKHRYDALGLGNAGKIHSRKLSSRAAQTARDLTQADGHALAQ